MGHRQQVQHGVGRAAQRYDHGDGIFERLLRHDVARLDALLEHVVDGGTGLAAVTFLGGTDRRLGTAARQAHPHRLDRAGHGIGRVHAAARAGAGSRARGDVLEALVGNLVVGMRADRLKHRDDVEFLRLAGDAARQNRTTVNKHRRAVHPRDGNHATRHIFVAATDGHVAVHALAAHNRLDRVGDHLAGDERVLHPLRAHRDAVGYGDRVEHDRLAAGLIRAGLGLPGQLVDVHVARRHVTPCGGDADDRLFEIRLLEPGRVKHCAARRTIRPIEHDRGMRPHVRRGFAPSCLLFRSFLHRKRRPGSLSKTSGKNKSAGGCYVFDNSGPFARFGPYETLFSTPTHPRFGWRCQCGKIHPRHRVEGYRR